MIEVKPSKLQNVLPREKKEREAGYAHLNGMIIIINYPYDTSSARF